MGDLSGPALKSPGGVFRPSRPELMRLSRTRRLPWCARRCWFAKSTSTCLSANRITAVLKKPLATLSSIPSSLQVIVAPTRCNSSIGARTVPLISLRRRVGSSVVLLRETFSDCSSKCNSQPRAGAISSIGTKRTWGLSAKLTPSISVAASANDGARIARASRTNWRSADLIAVFLRDSLETVT